MSPGEHLLHTGWQLLETPSGAFSDPSLLPQTGWRSAIVPGTVAQSLDLKITDVADLDAKDWWYRCTFKASSGSPEAEQILRFEGLATLAEVWLNGEKILSTRNMFVAHRCAVSLQGENSIYIRFRSLDQELAEKKPRPRWKTMLVTQQNLRWIRTTLLGRIPGWTPPIQPVGPWKNIVLETAGRNSLDELQIQTKVQGTTGHLRVSAKSKAQNAVLHLTGHFSEKVFKKSYPLSIGGDSLSGDISIPDVPLWWPHTHGDPELIGCEIELKTGTTTTTVDCGRIGFKTVALDRTSGKVELHLNGSRIFCRGACWTTGDFLSLTGKEESLRKTLGFAKAAGANMIRVGGTMVYESDTFYQLCDELGILVWQDFMFANMNYPVSDPQFRAEIDKEVTFQLKRFQKHPCMAVYCGGSEVQQQAAMMGLPSSEWSNEFFDKSLPERCEQLHPGIPYFPSSPCEGSLPFHVATGVSHYYGVGAYLRPLSDAKNSQVKFTSECLGFSNVPERRVLDLSDPAWKARVPRDNGTDWDFEDVRDHYTKELFRVDPISLRKTDIHRYAEISRVTTGEVMKSTFAEWRKPASRCAGGLVWFLKDIWPGAGWGIIDSLNQPKAVFHYLRRAWSKQTVLITDEGLDGLQLHALNDSAKPLRALLSLMVLKDSKIKTALVEVPVEIPAHGGLTFLSDEMLGYFADLTYSYRFGPPQHDVVGAFLKRADTGETIGEDYYFPNGMSLQTQEAGQLQAVATKAGEEVTLSISSSSFAQSVRISAEGFLPDDNYFHLAPGCEKRIRFVRNGTGEFEAQVSALNLIDSLRVRTT